MRGYIAMHLKARGRKVRNGFTWQNLGTW